MCTVFQNTELPKRRDDDSDLSVSVITYNKEGLLNIASYSYELNCWLFLTDELDERFNQEGFVWMYKPDCLKI